MAFVQDEADKLVWQSASSAPLLPLNKPELTTSEITVFPNPAKDQIQIFLPNGIENAQIRIWNSTGILVQTEPKYEAGNILALAALSEGIYYLEIKTTKGAVWKKLASAPLGNR